MVGLAILLGFLALLLLIAGDTQLPIWIFVTSFTLIVHTVLFKNQIPNEVYAVLKTMLKFLRLDFLPLDSENHLKPSEEVFLAGYLSTQFVTNMGYLLLGLLAVSLTLLLLGLTNDTLTPRSWRNRSCCKPALSMSIRALLIIMLEICICIGFEFRGLYDSGNIPQSKLAQFGLFLAIIFLILTVLLMSYVFSLLFKLQWALGAELKEKDTKTKYSKRTATLIDTQKSDSLLPS